MGSMTTFKNAILNIIAGTILAFSVFISFFYVLNFYKSDDASAKECAVRIINKYSEEHYRTKRVSKNHFRRGEKYLVYCNDIFTPDFF